MGKVRVRVRVRVRVSEYTFGASGWYHRRSLSEHTRSTIRIKIKVRISGRARMRVMVRVRVRVTDRHSRQGYPGSPSACGKNMR